MNRMWVRLSIIYGSIIVVIALVLIVVFSQVFGSPDVNELARRLDLNEADTEVLRQLDNMDVLRRVFGVTFITQLFGIFVLAILSGVIASIWSSWIITRPLTILDNAIRRLSLGDDSTRVHIQGASREVESLADSFNVMVDELAAAEKRRQHLLADVSHELRTPLTILQGNLRGMLDDVYTLDKDQIAKLYNHTRQLSHLVDDLHDLAQAEANRLPLVMMGVDLAQLVEQAGQLFTPLAQEAGIRLNVEVNPEMPMIRGDRQRLMQVLQNLIGNALRYARSEIHLTLTAQTDHVQLTIMDDGPGIDTSDLPHIFDRFYRTDTSRTRDTGGTGLGLAIVKSIVVAHNGTISARSRVDQGTTFSIILPLVPISSPDK